MGSNIVTDILTTLFSGLSQSASALPSALGDSIVGFMTTTSDGVTHLSSAGQIVIAFGAVSLSLSLVYLGINFVLSWGRNRQLKMALLSHNSVACLFPLGLPLFILIQEVILCLLLF